MSDSSVIPRDVVEWKLDVSLLGQPSMIFNFVKVIVGSFLIVFVFVGAAMLSGGTRIEVVLGLAQLFVMCSGIVAILMLFVILVFFRNRMTMAYRIDEDGARSLMIDRRARSGSRVAAVVGALSGQPGVAGAGLIAIGSESQFVRWSAVRKVRYSPRWKAIGLVNDWRTVMTLYCSDVNYDEVAGVVARSVGKSCPSKRKNPLPGLLFRTVLTLVACSPLFGLHGIMGSDDFIPFLTLGFALASVWLIPILAWLVFASLAWIAFSCVVATHVYGGVIALVPSALGCAYLAVQSAALLTGRVRSALLGDEEESA
jgi:hypothetical protein